jgi:hypothetical protein
VRQLAAALRFRIPRGGHRANLLVVASASDRLVDPACSVLLARRWKVPLRVHPSAGHELALDDPEWLADLCAAFVSCN